ncbi:unnamed protein product [[Candida] boidinii]|nr:unnamed protein product [[Candida] boidinii]
MEYEDEDEDEEVFPVADAADAHAGSERETSVEEEEEEEEHAEETENDINETKLPTSTSMLHSNSRSNSTNKLFSPVSTATSLSSDEDEVEVDKLSINEEFEKDECGFIKSDYSIDEINYIENKNHNNDQLNEFNLIINNSIVKSISLNDVLDHFKFFNNNYINLLLSIIKPIKDPNYYFKNFNLKFWIIILLCERKCLNIELFNYIKLKLNELLLINNTNNYSNDSNKISLDIELVESIIILTTYSIESKIDDDLTYYNWLLNLKNIYSINSTYNSNCSSSSLSLVNDYLKNINNLGIQYSLKLGLSWPDNKLMKNSNDDNNNQEDNNLLENYNLNYASKLSQEYLNCSYETNKLLADILKLDSKIRLKIIILIQIQL